MNFDMKTMMNLMQMMGGAANTPGGENTGAAMNFNAASGNNSNMMQTLFSMLGKGGMPFGNSKQQHKPQRDAAYAAPTRANARDNNYHAASPFAAENGLGGQFNPFEEQETQQTPPDDRSDMISNLMPMFMNMMSQKTPAAKTAEADGNQNGGPAISDDARPSGRQESENKDNAPPSAHADGKENCRYDSKDAGFNKKENGFNCADDENSRYGRRANNEPDKYSTNGVIKEEAGTNGHNKKTQPARYRDMYEPIAFAGYGLKSALNKLYFTSRRRLRREDIYRTVR